MAGEYITFNNLAEPAVNDDNLNLMQQLIKQDIQGSVSGDTLPVGAIIPFGSDTIPTNWLLCDGSAVSRETYQDLFNVIGISYGQGDGFTTFNLPDLREKTIRGKSTDADFNTLGKTGGEKTHVLTIDEMPTHNHELWAGNPGGNYTSPGNSYAQNSGTNKSFGYDMPVYNKGGNQPHNNLGPYQVGNYIIKAFTSAGLVADVAQAKTQSDSDTYSCNYINEILKVLGEGLLDTSNDILDCNDTSLATGTYYANGSTLNAPFNSAWYIIQLKRDATNITQLAISYRDNAIFIRHYNTVDTASWKDWFAASPSACSFINITMSNNFTNPSANAYNTVTGFDTTTNKKGDKLTLENGKIKVGKGISYIEVSGKIQLVSNGNATGGKNIIVRKNNNNFTRLMFYTDNSRNIDKSIPPIPVPVVEGDLIDIAYYGAKDDIISSGAIYTNLYVKTLM